jgi:hypothetical protein
MTHMYTYVAISSRLRLASSELENRVRPQKPTLIYNVPKFSDPKYIAARNPIIFFFFQKLCMA